MADVNGRDPDCSVLVCGFSCECGQSRGRSRIAGRVRCGTGRSDIVARGILSSTRVIRATSRLTGRVGAGASINTLVVGLHAEVEGNGLRVFGSVWRDAVGADTLIRERILSEE
jgi:hypothetical protein